MTVAKNVMQQEGRAFEWGKPLQRQQQGNRDIVVDPFRRVFGQQRLRQPRACVGFAFDTRRFQLIQTEPRHDTHQIAGYIPDVVLRHRLPA